jgi:hypothetical protein
LVNPIASTKVRRVRKANSYIQKGNGLKAAIDDFGLNSNVTNSDTSKALFNSTTPYVLVFAGSIDPNTSYDELLKKLHEKYKYVYIVTSDKSGAARQLPRENILIGDITMIKTAARVWPTIFVMNGSTIMQKQSYLDFLKK